MSRLRILGARVLDPARGIDDALALDVEDGRIVALAAEPTGTADETLAVDGLWLAPGPVDVHTHRLHPGREHQEGLRQGPATRAAGGFTTDHVGRLLAWAGQESA